MASRDAQLFSAQFRYVYRVEPSFPAPLLSYKLLITARPWQQHRSPQGPAQLPLARDLISQKQGLLSHLPALLGALACISPEGDVPSHFLFRAAQENC